MIANSSNAFPPKKLALTGINLIPIISGMDMNMQQAGEILIVSESASFAVKMLIAIVDIFFRHSSREQSRGCG